MPDALEIHAGFGTPVGYLGLVYDRVLWSRWSANVGFGVGSGRSGGSLQLATGTRFRVIQFRGRGSSVYVGVDYSVGGFRDLIFGDLPGGRVLFADWMHWLQGSIGYELRTASGVVFRPYFGIAFMLTPQNRRCVDDVTRQPCDLPYEPGDGESIPVYGLAVGGAM